MIDDDGNGYIDDINGWDFFYQNNTVYKSVYESVYNLESAGTHGTQIAGIIGAGANNGGIVGVSQNIKILPLKFISGGYGYTSDAISAIEYAKSIGVKIINCSWGGKDYNQALEDEMDSSGILFVCASGNSGADLLAEPLYPASFNLPNISQ